jgi:hypothetical protein
MGRAPIPTWYFALVVVRRGRGCLPLELLGNSELSV